MICFDLLKITSPESSINRVVGSAARQIAMVLAGEAEDSSSAGMVPLLFRHGAVVVALAEASGGWPCLWPLTPQWLRQVAIPTVANYANHRGRRRRELEAGLCCEATARAVLAELHRCSLPIIAETGTCWSAPAEAALLRDRGPCWVLFVDRVRRLAPVVAAPGVDVDRLRAHAVHRWGGWLGRRWQGERARGLRHDETEQQSLLLMALDLSLTLSLPCSYAKALRQLAWPVRGDADSLDHRLQRLGLVDHPRVLASGRPRRGYRAASAVLFQPHPGAFAALLDGAAVPRLLLAHDLDIRIVGYPPYAVRGSGDDAVVGVLVFGARDNQLIEAIEASPGYIAHGGAES